MGSRDMGIFHEATRQAIKEMIEEFGEASRFGRILNEDDLECAAARVATFLEMTLELRTGLGLAGPTQQARDPGAALRTAAPRQAAPRASGNRLGLPSGFETREDPALKPSGFARTRAAAEVAADADTTRGVQGPGRGQAEVRLPPEHDFRLPRKRVGASEQERESFTSNRYKG